MKPINELIKKVSVGIRILFMMCFLGGPLYGQKAGTLDTSFGNDGIVYCETMYDQLDYPSPVMDSQGRILTISSLTNGSGFVLVRCLMDGSFDHNFGDNGHVFFESDIKQYYNFIYLQKDDKILLAESIQRMPDAYENDTFDFFITRLLEDGSIDHSFTYPKEYSLGFAYGFFADDMIVQEDSKIIVCGYTGGESDTTGWPWAGGNTDVALFRLFSDGTPDSSFGVGGRVITDLTSSGWDADQGGPLAIQKDGKIVIAAKNLHGGPWSGGVSNFALVRYESNGQLDTTFANKGIAVDSSFYLPYSTDIVINDNGSILIAGGSGDVFSGGYAFTLRQYTPDGTLDPAFADGGIYVSPPGSNGRSLSAIKTQSDQKILATGFWGDSNGANLLLMRLTSLGKPDTTFASQGMAIHQFDSLYFIGKNVSLYPDGKITVVGTTISQVDNISKVFIARFYNDINTSVEKEPLERHSNFEVFPNPASCNLNIAFGEIGKNVVITIADISGKVVFKKTASTLQNAVVNTDDFSTGIYFIRVQTENINQTKKIFISK